MTRFLAVLALVAGAGPAGIAQQAPTRPITFTGDLNFVSTGGNTDVVSVGVGAKTEWRTSPRVTLKQALSWVYGKTDGEESANALLTGLRGAYDLSPRVDVFSGINYDYNLFAGVSRRFEEFAGVGVLLADAPGNKLRLDAGGSLFQEWALYAERSENFFAGRLVGDYKHLFTEKSYLQQVLEYLPNFDNSGDYRINSETALVAPVSSAIGLKVGYVVRYRGEPPEGFKKSDTTFRTGLQLTF